MAVTFYEDVGSPQFSATAKELRAVRTGEIAWANIDAFYQELFPPLGLPALCPGSSYLRAEAVDFAPLFKEAEVTSTTAGVVATPINNYATAHVTIRYKNYVWQLDAADHPITRRWSVGGQLLTIPNIGLVWADVSPVVPIKNPEMRGGIFVGTINHEVTVKGLATIPVTAIRSLIGKVNDATFEGAAAECLLFMGADIAERYASDGSLVYDAVFRFQERNVDGDTTVTWNHMYDPEVNAGAAKKKWRRVQRDSGHDMYIKGTFTDLFLIS